MGVERKNEIFSLYPHTLLRSYQFSLNAKIVIFLERLRMILQNGNNQFRLGTHMKITMFLNRSTMSKSIKSFRGLFLSSSLIVLLVMTSVSSANAQGTFIFLDITGLLLMKLGMLAGLFLARVILAAIRGDN